jgi:hypothetical protein
MRISIWPALVCGSMLAATIGHPVLAAPPADETSETVSRADAIDDFETDEDSSSAAGLFSTNPYQPMQYVQGGVVPSEPGMFGPPAGTFSPGAFDPAMTAPNGWPETSPYTQYPRQETFNSNGLWQYNANGDTKIKHFLTTEYLYAYGLKPGNHYIGSNQNHALDWFPGAFGGPFQTQTTELFGNIFHDGFKSSLGFENPDGSGLTMSGFILFQNSVDNDLVSPHAIAGQPGTLLPMWGIIVDRPDGTGLILPFDTRFFQKFQQEVIGADADFYLAPFFDRHSFKLKMLFGAKYLRIHEDFYVQGDMSGLGYEVMPSSNQATGPFVDQGIGPYSTVIQSSTTNNLVGPHLGLRYDLGGDRFKIWGQSKIAVAADVEKMIVAGSNVGSYIQSTGTIANPNLVAGPFVQTGEVAPSVRHQTINTHISPIFDTSINVDFPGFAFIPWVNKWAIFQDATMRIGFNYVFVGEVARPANIINYNLSNPTINPGNRTWFEYSSVNFAVNWKF